MTSQLKHWLFVVGVILVTCFSVFILPFLRPLPYLAGISVSNSAGFDNKVASVAAALISVCLLLWWLKRVKLDQSSIENSFKHLSRKVVLIGVLGSSTMLTLLSCAALRSKMLYLNDAGYFIAQIRMHVEYGRTLYTQIEFPYGPLIFYGPIFVHWLFSPFQISIDLAYYVTLIVEQIVGLLLVSYVVDNLPIKGAWKNLLFLLCAIGTLQLNLGLNYTFFRFMSAPAFLVLASKRKSPAFAAICFIVGEITSLAISPEIGIAFAAASFVYAAYLAYTRTRTWAIAAAAPFIAAGGFLLLINPAYLFMMKMFARGINNFIVEPLPHIILFLFALIWLVPGSIAVFVSQRRSEAPLLAAIYTFSLALLPAALGRADPGHIFFNGMTVFFLSMVAVSTFLPQQQNVWAACILCLSIWSTLITDEGYYNEANSAVIYAMLGYRPVHLKKAFYVFLHSGSLTAAEQSLGRLYEDRSFNLTKFEDITHYAPVATPLQLPLYVEEALRRSHQYTPSYYYAARGPYDASAEDRLIKELNASEWALFPNNPEINLTETPTDSGFALGVRLPYRAKRTPYVLGLRFNNNLAARWQPYARVGALEVYKRR